MALELKGIHHLTAITAQAQRNVEFYTRTLGMRLIKKTVNQDDVSAYHLFYGDGVASPGADLTFFDWPTAPERRGNHSISRTGAARRLEPTTSTGGRSTSTRAGVSLGQDRGARRPPVARLRGLRGPALPPGRRSAGPARRIPGRRARCRPSARSSGLGPITLTVPDLAPHRSRADRGDEHARGPHLSGTRERAAKSHVFEMGAGGAAAELHVEVQPRPAAGAARAPAACITSPSARPTRRVRRVGRSARHEFGVPLQRRSRALLLHLALFPRAQRHPVRDRHRRSGLCRRRAAGNARRAPGAAAVPRGQAGPRSRPG